MFVTIKINVVVLAVLQSMSQCVYTTAEGARSVRIAESLPVVKTKKKIEKYNVALEKEKWQQYKRLQVATRSTDMI